MPLPGEAAFAGHGAAARAGDAAATVPAADGGIGSGMDDSSGAGGTIVILVLYAGSMVEVGGCNEAGGAQGRRWTIRMRECSCKHHF